VSDSISYHSRLANSWSTRYQGIAFQERIQLFARAIQQSSVPGQSWLDAGCGTGEMAALFQDFKLEVSAVDASPQMVEHARVAAVVGRIEALPFPAGSFHGVVCSSVLEYVDDPAVALDEIHRVLKPGGHLLVSVPDSQSGVRRFQNLTYSVLRLPRYMRFSHHAFTTAEFNAFLAGHGFTNLHAESFGVPIFAGIHLPLGKSLRLHVATRNP
jgi:ubiquinone/menaquinone biosynthesis C-methylase UbiE